MNAKIRLGMGTLHDRGLRRMARRRDGRPRVQRVRVVDLRVQLVLASAAR